VNLDVVKMPYTATCDDGIDGLGSLNTCKGIFRDHLVAGAHLFNGYPSSISHCHQRSGGEGVADDRTCLGDISDNRLFALRQLRSNARYDSARDLSSDDADDLPGHTTDQACDSSYRSSGGNTAAHAFAGLAVHRPCN